MKENKKPGPWKPLSEEDAVARIRSIVKSCHDGVTARDSGDARWEDYYGESLGEVHDLLLDLGFVIGDRDLDYSIPDKGPSLFWVTTLDHGEDWFVVAPGEQWAADYHEGYEGYDVGDAEATFVMELPEAALAFTNGRAQHPCDDLLKACGGESVTSPSYGRAVRLDGKLYVEGTVLDSIVEEFGEFPPEPAAK